MEIQYEIRYKRNAKRVIIKSDYRGGLKITAPYGLSEERIEKILRHNQKRINKLFTDRENVYYLGKKYKIIDNIWEINTYKVIKDTKYIVLFHNQNRKKLDVLNKWLKDMAKNIINERVSYYSNILKAKVKSVKIKELSSIWGSCNSKGELSFNYLLIKTPMYIIDYVVVHEISHTYYLDHSTKFWTLVSSILPDYRERERWLKENIFLLT